MFWEGPQRAGIASNLHSLTVQLTLGMTLEMPRKNKSDLLKDQTLHGETVTQAPSARPHWLGEKTVVVSWGEDWGERDRWITVSHLFGGQVFFSSILAGGGGATCVGWRPVFPATPAVETWAATV